MPVFPNTLILISTYRCNLNCVYCPVDASSEDMPFETACESVSRFIENVSGPGRIRFFGGEPLLNAGFTEKVVGAADSVRPGKKELSFELTTNGTVLDREFIGFARSRNDFDLVLSIDGETGTQHSGRTGKVDSFSWINNHVDTLSQMRNVSVNKVISPVNVGSIIRDFTKIVKMGFTSINLLPAYYNFWPRESLEVLSERFGALARLLMKLNGENVFIRIKNAEIRGELPLFNRAMVVDTDGEVYSANHIMYRSLREFREEVRRTNVFDFDPGALSATAEADMEFMTRHIPENIIASTLAVDALLSQFVSYISNPDSTACNPSQPIS